MSPMSGQSVSTTPINSHGDLLLPTSKGHGPDISSQRTDDLDREALRNLLELCGGGAGKPSCVDLGSGYGAQSLRFAALGATVLMIDIMDRADFAAEANRLLGDSRISAWSGDVRSFPVEIISRDIDILYSQRMIHYLPFMEAASVLSLFGGKMTQGGRLYLSAACMRSELAEGYECADNEIESRFGRLHPSKADKHGVHEALVLYQEEEFVELAERAGFSVVSVKRSEFGTLKGVFQSRA